jgi:hypothetical protein
MRRRTFILALGSALSRHTRRRAVEHGRPGPLANGQANRFPKRASQDGPEAFPRPPAQTDSERFRSVPRTSLIALRYRWRSMGRDARCHAGDPRCSRVSG